MITLALVGLLAMLACLAMQVAASVIGANYFGRTSRAPLGPKPWRWIILQFSVLMLVLMIGSLVQIILWAALYQAFGAFDGFETALYFSGVTFTSLGYGDVTLSGRIRMLAPLQAATGLMMFGITTALLIAAFQRASEKWAMEQ